MAKTDTNDFEWSDTFRCLRWKRVDEAVHITNEFKSAPSRESMKKRLVDGRNLFHSGVWRGASSSIVLIRLFYASKEQMSCRPGRLPGQQLDVHLVAASPIGCWSKEMTSPSSSSSSLKKVRLVCARVLFTAVSLFYLVAYKRRGLLFLIALCKKASSLADSCAWLNFFPFTPSLTRWRRRRRFFFKHLSIYTSISFIQFIHGGQGDVKVAQWKLWSSNALFHWAVFPAISIELASL